jgi:hypothetical protein
MTRLPLTVEMAEKVYAVLVKHAGAPISDTSSFVASQTRRYMQEWRFCGSLGFGGKLWRDCCEPFAVNCYSEDETSERLATIAVTNAALKELL